jgi:mRNA-degrading endonuclease RelE of RelBE toxin-antitoxin system
MKTIIFTVAAAKQLDALPAAAREQVGEGLARYAIAGEGDVKRLSGRNGHRMRIGRYRVLFDEDQRTILAIYIGKQDDHLRSELKEPDSVPAQTIRTPGGEEMVMLPKAEYEALLRAAAEAAEDTADIAAYDSAKANLEGSERLPFEVSQLMLQGNSLLKALRIWRDETQLHLAFKTGTSQGFVSDLENGRRKMTEYVSERLAKALDVPVSWLRL